jgi:hypothetical protein
VVLLLTCFRIAGACDSGLAEIPGAARIHIRLVDLVGLPEKVRTQSEAVVIGVFRRAGLDVAFVECLAGVDNPCREATGPADFWLQILKQRPRHLHGDTTGFAVLVPSPKPGDSYAAVSYPMVEATALELDAAIADVLAASLAHEMGHLLLHASSHSRTGIMNPRLDRRQMWLMERGELLFTKEQATRLAERARQLAR